MNPLPGSSPRVLGIDLGTSAVKVLVVTLDGTVLGRAAVPYPIHHPQPGAAEQDPAAWWQATVSAVRDALRLAGVGPIAAIGLSGQMHGTVLLNEHDALGPAIIWPDRRSAAHVAAVTARIGAERLIQITGSPLATGFQVATVRWVQTQQPERWRRTKVVLLPKDYLGWKLTGDFVTDPSDASSTLLFDIHADDWSPDLLAAVDIRRDQLPRIAPSHGVRGTLLPDAATALGLSPGIPVIVGGGDAPLAALAAGATVPATMLLTISSGSQVIIPASDPVVDLEGRIHTWRGALDRGARWYQMGATLSSGLALSWLRDQVFALERPDAHEAIERMVAATPPGAAGLLFLPYLTGERTPHLDPEARGIFLGLTAAHGQGHLARAVMEGATLALFDAYAVLADLGANPTRAILTGGGARSAAWRQIVADVFGIPIVPLTTTDGSALGAALLAAAGIGALDLHAAARTWPRYDAPIQPNPAAHAIYQRLLPIFRAAYLAHRDDFGVLAEIASTQ